VHVEASVGALDQRDRQGPRVQGMAAQVEVHLGATLASPGPPVQARAGCRRRAPGAPARRRSAGHWIHVPVTGRTRAPGPGRPVSTSTVAEPDVASQKVATSVASPVFGKAGSGNGGVGAAVAPFRTMGFGKHGVAEAFVQQFWLTPPFTSTHWPVGVVP